MRTRRLLLILPLPLTLALTLACGAQDSSVPVGVPGAGNNPKQPPGTNTNVGFGGAQDFGYFRRLVEAGQVPQATDLDAAGFFAEHHTELPDPTCGRRLCVQAMVGSMGNLITGAECTILQVGLNSPVAIDPESRPPLTLAVVIDVSGSMNEQGKISYVRAGLIRLMDALKDGDQLTLISYSSEASVLAPLGPIEGERVRLQGLARNLKASGATNLWAGLELGYQEIRQNFDPSRQNRVILLSDGEPTVGEVSTEAILALSRPYNSEGIGLTTIGLGSGFNIELMRGLSEQGDGNFYFVENAGAVEEVFSEEVSTFTVPLAFDVELRVDAGADFRFLGAFGAPSFASDSSGGTLSLPSVFLAGRTSDQDVTPQGGRRGGGSALLLELSSVPDQGATPGYSEVAQLHLEYRDGESQEWLADDLTVAFPFEVSALSEGGFFDNDLVTKSFVMLNILVGLQAACDQFHQGGGDQAVLTLRRLAAAVEDYNLEIGDVDFVYDLETIRGLDRALLANGVADPEDPPIPANPWPRE